MGVGELGGFRMGRGGGGVVIMDSRVGVSG